MPTFAFHLEMQTPPGTTADYALHLMCETLLRFNGTIPPSGGRGVRVTRCAPIERDDHDTSLPALVDRT